MDVYLKTIDADLEDEEIKLAASGRGVAHLRHQLNLCSEYLSVPGSCRTQDNHGNPLATSYHSKFMGTFDYIWHTKKLVPVRVLETLPIDVLRRSVGLPSQVGFIYFPRQVVVIIFHVNARKN